MKPGLISFALLLANLTFAEEAKKDVATPPFIDRKIKESAQPPGCYDEKTKTYKTYKVAFTFDDGPAQGVMRPLSTSKVIKTLKDKGDIKAVFFISGQSFGERKIARHHPPEFYAEQFKEHIAGGHFLANHTWDHLTGSSFGARDDEWLENATMPLVEYGEKLLPAVRLPYGDQAEPKDMKNGTGKVPLILKEKMIPEYWTIDSEDHRSRNTEKIIAKTFEELCHYGGGIILMHDIHPTTADALGPLIDALRAQGHQIVNPKELRPQWFDPDLNKKFQAHVSELKERYALRTKDKGELLFPGSAHGP